MTFLAPFIAPILSAITWIGSSVLPGLARGILAHMFAKAGIGLITGLAVYASVQVVLGIIRNQVAALGSSATYASAAVQLLSLFGVFEALSLILSAYIAKATWLMMKPSLSLLDPPTP